MDMTDVMTVLVVHETHSKRETWTTHRNLTKRRSLIRS